MLPIQKLFINYNRTVRTEKPRYIVIHDVGAVSTARNNRDYFAGGNRGASADFFVDANNIIQVIDYNKYYSWAVGDGRGEYGITNSNSVSIEMCLEENYQPSQNTIQNTLDLIKYLIKELNIPASNIVRHYDASRKLCPRSFSYNNWVKWNEFKSKLSTNSFIKLDGGSHGDDLNLIIRDYSDDIEKIYAWVDNDDNASFAFAKNIINNNYVKLNKNCSKAIKQRANGNTFTQGATYKIKVKAYDKYGKIVAENMIILTIPKIKHHLYKVQVGAFRNKEYAENLQKELKGKGYKGFITE